MTKAELPPDEELRLADLASYDIIDTIPENDFDELVELASQICNTPISLITLLDSERQWFKAKRGLTESSTSRDVAFCAHAILDDDVMLVEDAWKDERFHDNPLVTGDLNIRFYAGAPIISPGGHNLGTICIIDNQPKKLTEEEKRALKLLSKQATKLLELRKKNMLIRSSAEELIALKSKTINRAIHLQEQDKKEIALMLHEHLAQSLASSIMYLKIAADNEEKRLSNILIAREQLNKILGEIKELSNSITPVMLNWISPEELVAEFIGKIAVTFPFRITLVRKGKKANAPTDKTLILIRVVEEWLKVLAVRKGISVVKITLHQAKEFRLTFENDGPLLSFESLEREMFDGLIYDRMSSIGGTINFSSETGKNILEIGLLFLEQKENQSNLSHQVIN